MFPDLGHEIDRGQAAIASSGISQTVADQFAIGRFAESQIIPARMPRTSRMPPARRLSVKKRTALRTGNLPHRRAGRGRVDVARDEVRPGNGENSRFLKPDEMGYKQARVQPAGRKAGMVTGGSHWAPGHKAAISSRGFP